MASQSLAGTWKLIDERWKLANPAIGSLRVHTEKDSNAIGLGHYSERI